MWRTRTENHAMIRHAINAELARRANLNKPKEPFTASQLAKALDLHPQSIYRMLSETRPSFLTAHADRMMEMLVLRLVRGVARG